MTDKLEPFFILGNPRSGTSVFRLMLNRHSEVVVPPECGYLLWYRQKYSAASFADVQTLTEFANDVLSAKKFETWGLGLDELMSALLTESPHSYAEACACVHRSYALTKGKKTKIWGDKNNYYVSESEKLLELYPKAKFLFVIRDPRDVFASYLDLANLKTDSKYAPKLTVSALDFGSEWLSNLKSMDALATQLSETDYLYVRYEDVVGDSEQTLTKVLEFLGVQFEARVIAPDDKIQFIEKEPADTLDWKKLTQKAPDQSRIGRYRSVLNDRQVSEIAERCRYEMSRFGYLELPKS